MSKPMPTDMRILQSTIFKVGSRHGVTHESLATYLDCSTSRVDSWKGNSPRPAPLEAVDALCDLTGHPAEVLRPLADRYDLVVAPRPKGCGRSDAQLVADFLTMDTTEARAQFAKAIADGHLSEEEKAGVIACLERHIDGANELLSHLVGRAPGPLEAVGTSHR